MLQNMKETEGVKVLENDVVLHVLEHGHKRPIIAQICSARNEQNSHIECISEVYRSSLLLCICA